MKSESLLWRSYFPISNTAAAIPTTSHTVETGCMEQPESFVQTFVCISRWSGSGNRLGFPSRSMGWRRGRTFPTDPYYEGGLYPFAVCQGHIIKAHSTQRVHIIWMMKPNKKLKFGEKRREAKRKHQDRERSRDAKYGSGYYKTLRIKSGN